MWCVVPTPIGNMEFTRSNNRSGTDGSAGAFQQNTNEDMVDQTHLQQPQNPMQSHQQFASSYKYQPSNNYVMHQQHQQSMPNTPAAWSRNNSSLQSIQEMQGGAYRSASGPLSSVPPQMEQPSTQRPMFPPPTMPLQQQQHHVQNPWSVMHLPSLAQNSLNLMQQQQHQQHQPQQQQPPQQQQHQYQQVPKLSSSAMSSLHNTPLGSTREPSAEKMKLDFILNREDSGGGSGSGSGSLNMNMSAQQWQAPIPPQQQQPPMFYTPVSNHFQQLYENQQQHQHQHQQHQQYMASQPVHIPITTNVMGMIPSSTYNLVDVNPSSLKTAPKKGVEELKREMDSRVQTVRKRAITPTLVKEEDVHVQQQLPQEEKEQKEQQEQQEEATSTPTSNMLTHSNSTNMRRKRKLVKNFWTEEEDEQLLHLVGVHGAKNWNKIAADHMPHRRGSQLRSRYIYVLSAQDSQPAPFTEQEDLFILDAYQKHGPKWSLMASTLNNNRKDQEVKHRFRKLQRSINRSKKYGGNAPGSLGVIGRLMDSKGELDWSRVDGASGLSRMVSGDDSGAVRSGTNSVAGPSRKSSGSMAELGTDDCDEDGEEDGDGDDDESLDENDNLVRHRDRPSRGANNDDTEQQDHSINNMMM